MWSVELGVCVAVAEEVDILTCSREPVRGVVRKGTICTVVVVC
jgi:hypothetical protein